jgi:hypothetical protein
LLTKERMPMFVVLSIVIQITGQSKDLSIEICHRIVRVKKQCELNSRIYAVKTPGFVSNVTGQLARDSNPEHDSNLH